MDDRSDSPTPRGVRATEPAPGSRAKMFQLGELVAGVYEVRALLGEGGMAQVFEAHDHQLDRRVALKVAWPRPEAPPLRNEARALAAFRHRSLPAVYTAGQHRGTDYIVMERIYGVPLDEHLKRQLTDDGAMPTSDVLQILIDVAEGLGVVHRAGLAHRDVKLSNIMLTSDSRVVLLDFGLVLPEFEIDGQSNAAGSLSYMAPEAIANVTASGSGHLVDLYALGVVGYKLLTATSPHEAGRNPDELLKRQLNEQPPEAAELRTDVPARLSKLLADLMHPDPSERPPSAESVVWQLKAVRERELAPQRSDPLRVLIVDDDEDVARVLGFYVKRALGDVSVRVARDGEQALAELKREAPDVMLLDLQMPRVNGLEVCMYMRGARLAEDCTIIPVSAGAQEHDRQLLHQLGIHHFLSKGDALQERLPELLRQVSGLGRGQE